MRKRSQRHTHVYLQKKQQVELFAQSTQASPDACFIGLAPCDNILQPCSQHLPPPQELKLHFKLHNDAFVGNRKRSFQLFTHAECLRHPKKIMATFKEQGFPILTFTSVKKAHLYGTYRKGKKCFSLKYSLHRTFLIFMKTDRVNEIMTKDSYKFENPKQQKQFLNKMIHRFWLTLRDATLAKWCWRTLLSSLSSILTLGTIVAIPTSSFEFFAWSDNLGMDFECCHECHNSTVGLLQKPDNFIVDIRVEWSYNKPSIDSTLRKI